MLVLVSGGIPAIKTQAFCRFLQDLQVSSGTVNHLGHEPFILKPFQVVFPSWFPNHFNNTPWYSKTLSVVNKHHRNNDYFESRIICHVPFPTTAGDTCDTYSTTGTGENYTLYLVEKTYVKSRHGISQLHGRIITKWKLQYVLSLNIFTIRCSVINDPIMKTKPIRFRFRNEYSSTPTALRGFMALTAANLPIRTFLNSHLVFPSNDR